MITLILVVILGALLLVVLLKLSKKPEAPPEPRHDWRTKPAAAPAPDPPDLANLKITDAQAGDAMSISGAGDGMTDLDFTADRLTRVEAGARRWFELSGPYRERRVTLRVGGDEEVEAALHNSSRKITLEDLGVSEDDLAQMDERQNTGDSFGFEDKVWMYLFSREARARRDDGQPANAYYYWEFREQGGKGILGLRKAEGEPFTVTDLVSINPGDVTIYRSR
jgi:hypothetical protein